MWQYLFGVVLGLWIVKWYRSLFTGYENIDKMFPGPRPLPFIGNALMSIGDTPTVYRRAMSMMRLYKRSVRVWVAHRLVIALGTPSEVEALLNNTVHIRKAWFYGNFLPWIGRGLLLSDGDKWKKHRKLLTPAFHFKILDGYFEIFDANGNILLEMLENQIDCPGFNVLEHIKLYALDNICETSMGVKIDAQLNPDSDLTKAIKMMCNIVNLRLIRPHYHFPLFFNLTKYRREQEKALAVIHSFTKNVITKRIRQRAESVGMEGREELEDLGVKTRKSFLDILLDVEGEGSLTQEELQHEVDTFMFEGHDTIASALSFCIYNLAHYKQYQDAVFNEQAEIFKDNNSGCCSHDDISKMKYLEMVIKESLRLYPSVPLIGRTLDEDLRLDDLSVIPKGAESVIFVTSLHRHPDIWERPDEFYPEHFLPDVAAKRHPYAYIPFSAGPRNCIGMKFAMLEMKSVLSKIIRKFELRPASPKVDLVPIGEVTLQSKTGQHISLKLRTYDNNDKCESRASQGI